MSDDIKENILNVLTSCDTVQFTTFIEAKNYPETRAILNVLNKDKKNIDDLILYFFTNIHSHKVEQIKNNNKVSLYYYNPNTKRSITLFGEINIIIDKKEKIKFWKDDWTNFGYNGKDDENYCIIKFIPKIYKYYVNKTEEKTGEISQHIAS